MPTARKSSARSAIIWLHDVRRARQPAEDLKANALELLHALLPGRLHKILLPLVDEEIPVAEKLRVGASLRGANWVSTGS